MIYFVSHLESGSKLATRNSEEPIFGSYIRGEQTKDSDLDVLVQFDKKPGLLKYIELENYLSDLLEVKVDLVMKSALKPNIGKRILNEVKAL